MKIVGGKWSNWSGSVVCKPRQIVAPKDEVELAAAVRNAEGTVRAPGNGYSFTPLCVSDDTLIDMAGFTGLKSVDVENAVATFSAATPLWAVGPALCGHGLALANMGDIDRPTLAGAVGTGMHGSGCALGSLSAQVTGFRLILANGDVLNCSSEENPDLFAAGRVSMGTFGLMTEISLKVEPAYRLVEKTFSLPIAELFEQLDALVADNRHFEFLWFPYAESAVCRSLNPSLADAPPPPSVEEMFARGERVGAERSAFAGINEILPYTSFLLRPAHGLFCRLMSAPRKVGWSYEIFPRPRTIRFNEMEYALPRAEGPQCLREIVAAIRRKKINTGFPIAYRTVAADDIWLSPFHRRDSACIAVYQYHRLDATNLFETCEDIFRSYAGRPHWGKSHRAGSQDFAALYPEFGRFQALRRELDPGAKFLNAHLRTIFD